MIRILPYGHENLSAEALHYVQRMAEHHGFRILERDNSDPRLPFRIELNFGQLKDRIYWAVAVLSE